MTLPAALQSHRLIVVEPSIDWAAELQRHLTDWDVIALAADQFVERTSLSPVDDEELETAAVLVIVFGDRTPPSVLRQAIRFATEGAASVLAILQSECLAMESGLRELGIASVAMADADRHAVPAICRRLQQRPVVTFD